MRNKIIIVNKHNFQYHNKYVVNIMRQNILSNPFKIDNQNNRNDVCNKFEIYFENEYKTNLIIQKEIDKIINQLKISDVYLLCCCKPKRCHGDFLKIFIEKKIHNINNLF